MKNRIARNCKSDISSENTEESQQAIKFFKILLSKIII